MLMGEKSRTGQFSASLAGEASLRSGFWVRAIMVLIPGDSQPDDGLGILNKYLLNEWINKTKAEFPRIYLMWFFPPWYYPWHHYHHQWEDQKVKCATVNTTKKNSSTKLLFFSVDNPQPTVFSWNSLAVFSKHAISYVANLTERILSFNGLFQSTMEKQC